MTFKDRVIETNYRQSHDEVDDIIQLLLTGSPIEKISQEAFEVVRYLLDPGN